MADGTTCTLHPVPCTLLTQKRSADRDPPLQANPLLFSLIRSTEPYLDEYADYQTSGGLPADLAACGFGTIRLTAATGRHFALVATKGPGARGQTTKSSAEGAQPPGGGAVGAGSVIDDRRAEFAKPDTHLKTWEAKSSSSSS